MYVMIVLPIHNEEAIIERAVVQLHSHCTATLADMHWTIVIADNGSTDASEDIIKRIALGYPNILYDARTPPGRGGALQQAWSLFDADVYVYMDCDLATDLRYLRECIDAIMRNKYDIAIGSRLVTGSCAHRSVLRTACSYMYSIVPRLFFPSFPIRDCQCGFKAISHRTKKELLPRVQDQYWFFDTELLIRGHYANYRIMEMPVWWKDQRFAQRKSKVRLIHTALGNIAKLFELKKNPDLRR